MSFVIYREPGACEGRDLEGCIGLYVSVATARAKVYGQVR